jgi:hypothetical protein
VDLVKAWRQAQLGELTWDTADGPDATVVVPMTDEGVPCVALSYDQLARADALAAAGSAIASISAPGLLGGADPLRVRVRVTRSEDLDGERFEDSKLLLQELAKHPPSRRRLDSILLRREHWWFLPRILLHLEPTEDPAPLASTGALLAHRTAGGLEVSGVHVTRRDGERLHVDGVTLATPRGPAVLLEHGAEPPDLERRWTFRRYGELDPATSVGTTGGSTTLVVRREESWGRTDRSPTLLQRIRDERTLERACIAGLRSSRT